MVAIVVLLFFILLSVDESAALAAVALLVAIYYPSVAVPLAGLIVFFKLCAFVVDLIPPSNASTRPQRLILETPVFQDGKKAYYRPEETDEERERRYAHNRALQAKAKEVM